MLQIITTINEIKQSIQNIKNNRLTIGFVPTMGALHEGHLNLIRQARKENDRVIVSIFVNPLQFGKNEDFKQYPRTFDKDCELLSMEGVDILFSPSATEMYPEGFCVSVIIEHLEDKLCGRLRQGHFRGVSIIVTKLFNIIKPDNAYFGQKDFQQTVIIKRLVADLNLDVNIKVHETIRDKDGLALSSRNLCLNKTERQEATCLYRSLTKAKSLVSAGTTNPEEIIHEMEKIINDCKTAKIDYISIVNPETLELVTNVNRGDVAVLAVKVGNIRLIDNMILMLLLTVQLLFLYF